MIAEVVVNVPLRRTFDYTLPPGLSDGLRGRRAIVPFGRRMLTGVVVGVKAASELPPNRLRAIYRVVDETTTFTEELFRFTHWVAEYYLCGWGEVLDAALPAGLGARFRTRFRLAPDADPERALEALPEGARALVTREPLWSAAQLARTAGRDADALAAIEAWLERERGEGGTLEPVYEPEGPGRAREKRWVRLRDESAAAEAAQPAGKRETRREQLLRLLLDEGELPIARLTAHMPSPTPVVNRLVADGLAEVFLREEAVRGVPVALPDPEPFHELTPDQAAAVAAIRESLDASAFRAFLLEGVTGSGKTEVYLHAVRDALERGRTALVLVPEIALTAEIQRRFRSRFGSRVAVLHSGMEEGQRYAEWMRARRGEARVVIGARSALFAPLPDLGLIVVDEEHDGSYKQDDAPRYHARDAALVRGRDAGAVVLLGSATPSMESLHNVAAGKLTRLPLPARVADRPLPEVRLIHMRHAKRQKGSALFSKELVEALRTTVGEGRQAILFLNRRGFAQLMRCEVCGEAVTCPNCSLSLVFHRAQRRLRCHHCEFASPVPEACPDCGAEALKEFGVGTERIEEEVGKLCPTARIIRLDSDAIRRRGALERTLARIRRREADVIIGTQILTKGHDYPDITLVGAVLADVSLNLPDFRAAERTFQVLTQMAGRAGRGDAPGSVLIQTYNPHHHALVHVADHSTTRFAETELALREATQTPPFSHQVLFWVSSTHADRAARLADDLDGRLRALRTPGVTVLGPAEAPIRRINRRYRWMVLLRAPSAARMRQMATRVLDDPGFKINPPDRIAVDVDPQSLL